MSRRMTMLLAAAAAFRLLWLVSVPLPVPAAKAADPAPNEARTGSPTPVSTDLPPTAAPEPTAPAPTPTQPPSTAATTASIPAETPLYAAEIKNDTSYSVDAAAMAAEPLGLRLSSDGPQILILHTHGTEAYTAEPGREYEATDPYRTVDGAHSVIRVGETLAEALRRQGLDVVHDTGLYDYPRYAGSYERSEAAARAWLERCPSISVVIDLHRDAVSDDPAVCRAAADRSGGEAQVMLVVGTGENGLEHPNWRENLKLALALQRVMDETSPGLARPIQLARERYNQHLTTGSLILEVGANSDTLTAAERAAERFAQAAGPVLLSLIDD